MFCASLGQDIRRAFTGPLVLWFTILQKIAEVIMFEHTMCSSNLQGTQVKETGQ